MRRGVTLVELIITIAISSLLIVGSSNIIKSISFSAQRAKQLTELSLDSRSALEIISSLLYHRVPNSAIGYDGISNFSSLKELNSSMKILEWLGTIYEANTNDTLSNFIDLQASDFTTKMLKSPSSDFFKVSTTFNDKFARSLTHNGAISFAGSFDNGASSSKKLGFHGSSKDEMFVISSISSVKTNFFINNANQPLYIYEKFYLSDSAYAVARVEDIDKSATCIKALQLSKISNISQSQIDDALILFSDYRPYLGQSFCADKGNKGVKSGTATLLSLHVSGFRVEHVNSSIKISIDTKMPLNGSKEIIKVSKQKVVL